MNTLPYDPDEDRFGVRYYDHLAECQPKAFDVLMWRDLLASPDDGDPFSEEGRE